MWCQDCGKVVALFAWIKVCANCYKVYMILNLHLYTGQLFVAGLQVNVYVCVCVCARVRERERRKPCDGYT